MKVLVKDASSLTDVPVRAIIGIGERAFEIVPKNDRSGFALEVSDENGLTCLLYVREMGKPRSLTKLD